MLNPVRVDDLLEFARNLDTTSMDEVIDYNVRHCIAILSTDYTYGVAVGVAVQYLSQLEANMRLEALLIEAANKAMEV